MQLEMIGEGLLTMAGVRLSAMLRMIPALLLKVERAGDETVCHLSDIWIPAGAVKRLLLEKVDLIDVVKIGPLSFQVDIDAHMPPS